MNHKHTEHQHDEPVTLEALLSLKRTERPHAAFWERFDRQLKEKTIQSLWAQERPFYKRFFDVQWKVLTPLRGALCLGSLLMIQLHCLVPSWTQALGSFLGRSTHVAAIEPDLHWLGDPVADALKQPDLLFVASSMPLGDSEGADLTPMFSLKGSDESAWGMDASAFHIAPSLELSHAHKPIVFF